MSPHALLHRLLAAKGEKLEDTLSYSNLGKLVRRTGVRGGSEFDRIKALPRRIWEEDPDLERLIDGLTERLLYNKDACPGHVWIERICSKCKKHDKGLCKGAKWIAPKGGVVCSGCKSPRRLRPHQAKGLQELHDYGRLLADFPVGEGKTLVSFVAPVVLAMGLGCTPEELAPVLLLPANLEGKTVKEFARLACHWDGYRKIERLSYEKLSREKQVNYFERMQPKLVLADEAYALKNVSGARAKRLRRWLESAPTTVFLPLTGTPWKDTVHDYAHLSEWALKDLSPVPHHKDGAYLELADWANCVDVEPRETRLAAGVLAEFCKTPPTSVEDVRAALAVWRNQTPSWVRVSSSGVDASLTLQGVKFDDYPAHVEQKFKRLRESYETPDGLAFTEPSKQHNYLKCCSSEFWYRYDPPPPERWKKARRAWGSLVRDTIAHNKHHWDTELQVARACARGQLVHHGVYSDWVKIRPSYNPEDHKLTEWFGDSFIQWCIKWLEKEKSILFTSQIAVGERLKAETGLPYFHNGGLDPQFGSIEDWKGGPCIASVDSNKKGRNIQHLWHKACVVGGLASGPDAEQLIGRLHRPGTEADVVEYTFPYGCLEVFETLHRSREQAKFADSPTHKLILGDFLVESLDDSAKWKGSRWQKSS